MLIKQFRRVFFALDDIWTILTEIIRLELFLKFCFLVSSQMAEIRARSAREYEASRLKDKTENVSGVSSLSPWAYTSGKVNPSTKCSWSFSPTLVCDPRSPKVSCRPRRVAHGNAYRIIGVSFTRSYVLKRLLQFYYCSRADFPMI